MFEVIHTFLLVPFVAVGIAVGSTCGPMLGAVDGFMTWRKMKQVHDAEKFLKEDPIPEPKPDASKPDA